MKDKFWIYWLSAGLCAFITGLGIQYTIYPIVTTFGFMTIIGGGIIIKNDK